MRERRAEDVSRVSSTGSLSPEDLAWQRRLAHRRRRLLHLLGAIASLAVIAAAAVLVLGSGGSRGAADRHAQRARPLIAARPRPKPPPPILLPRGGRVLLPGHLVVAYYGIVGTSNILGQTGDPEADAAGVERTAHDYVLFGRPVQPAFELVATVASPYPGPDGSYSSAVELNIVKRYLEAAHRHKLLLILDFQPGRGEFLPEVRRYARFLLDPAVGVALDPEWKLTSEEVPDEVIGSSSAGAINAVSAYLSALTVRHRLPQKLFIVHEFRTTELPDRGKIAIRPRLATVLQMDGLGPVSSKLYSYRQVMNGAQRFYPGFKVFLRPVDDPVRLTPAQIIALRPRPAYISYQ
ncbi:MAG: hypothetical protein JO168_13980 [Solirubrobacterales bacterium]|nr:hypothetical protein [Solirubrobacterales bacterium]MBV9716122.1 hypothetical protein [Solirubrobacterales bacterium]